MQYRCCAGRHGESLLHTEAWDGLDEAGAIARMKALLLLRPYHFAELFEGERRVAWVQVYDPNEPRSWTSPL